MNIPTDGSVRFFSAPEHIQLKRNFSAKTLIVKNYTSSLYQISFQLTTAPSRIWKELFMELWNSDIIRNAAVSETVVWIFNTRILINKVNAELSEDKIKTLVSSAIEQTNVQIKIRFQRAI